MHDVRSLGILLFVLVGAFLIFLGVLVSRVGGMQIRSASQTVEVGALLSDQGTLSPGAPTRFRVSSQSMQLAARASLRLPNQSVDLGPVPVSELQGGGMLVTVPCSGDFLAAGVTQRGRIVLLAAETAAVLAQSGEVAVLPAGPDCFFSSAQDVREAGD